jgi:hypothetical protein
MHIPNLMILHKTFPPNQITLEIYFTYLGNKLFTSFYDMLHNVFPPKMPIIS